MLVFHFCKFSKKIIIKLSLKATCLPSSIFPPQHPNNVPVCNLKCCQLTRNEVNTSSLEWWQFPMILHFLTSAPIYISAMSWRPFQPCLLQALLIKPFLSFAFATFHLDILLTSRTFQIQVIRWGWGQSGRSFVLWCIWKRKEIIDVVASMWSYIVQKLCLGYL
jgi:hypothetical protein